MKNLFVYGTLMNDEIQEALVGRSFKKSAAAVDGFIASDLEGRYSPGLKRKEDSVVNGYVLHDVDDESFQIIKAWENDDYELIQVEPNNGDFGECSTYLWKSDILNTPWDNENFRENHMQWYLDDDIPTFLRSYIS